MAFLSKFGNILKQTPSKQLNGGQVSLSSPSLFQAIRCIMTFSKLFVGGIGYSMDVEDLREAFSKYGEVYQVRIIVDFTGRSRGFGFVTFVSGESSSHAIKALNGRDLHGRVLKVEYAIDRNSDGVAILEALREFLDDMRKKHGKIA